MSDDAVHAALYPDQPPPGPHGTEPDWLGLHADQTAYLRQAAAPHAGPVPGHGPMVAAHEHEHPAHDRQGGSHTHRHVHDGDASHQPGTNHLHQLAAAASLSAADEAVYAGIWPDPIDAEDAYDRRLERRRAGPSWSPPLPPGMTS